MERNIEDEVRIIEAYVQGEQGRQQAEPPEEEIYHVYDVPGGIVILREGEVPEAQNATVIDSQPVELDTNIPVRPLPGKTPVVAHITISMYLFLILSCIMFQIYVIANPFTVTVTFLAKSQQINLAGTLNLGRVLSPITLSQSATTNTTGHAHQKATSAIGELIFYNGQANQVTIPAGTVLTGSDGQQVITNQDATIPAANPPSWGITTVSAHAVNAGSSGNISAYDINQSCCTTSVFAKNTAPFHSGQDERNFTIVTQADMNGVAATLKTTLAQSMQGALQGELRTGEALQANPCSPTVIPDHPLGTEATHVKVTVSLTCSGIAYNTQTLASKVTALLTTQATKKLGAGYSILGNPQVNITQASAVNTKVIISFKAQSAWIYALSDTQQKIMKKLIAGKNKQEAMQLLHSLPGIESVSMQSSGFGDDTRIPKDISHIHMLIIYAI